MSAKLDAFFARFSALELRQVHVGLPRSEGSKPHRERVTGSKGKARFTTGKANLATIAAVHEFGSPARNIPERPFLRQGIRRTMPRISQVCRARLRDVANGSRAAESVFHAAGVVSVGGIKREFLIGNFAPNSPRTIARKGSSRPLIDTGQLRQSIAYTVEGAR